MVRPGHNITGATTGTLTFATTVADNNKQYRAVWTNIAGTATSNAATLIVNPIPAAPSVSVTNNCGSSVLTATGAPGATFSWSNGATTEAITVTTNGTYTVNQTVNNCTSAEGSGVAAPKPIPALSSSLTATATSSSAFSYTATSSTSGTTFAWSRAAVTGISNAAATGNGNISETLVNTTTSPVNVTYVYTLTANGCTNTQNVVVTVGVDGSIVSPAVTTQPASQTKCAGVNVIFNSAASGSPAPTVQWQESTNGTTWNNITGATTGTLTFATTVADNNKQYRAVWTNIAGTATSNAATLIVNPIPAAPSVSVTNNCGSSVLTATGAPGATFSWSNGATTEAITVTTNGTYTVNQTVNNCTSAEGSGVAAPKPIPALSSSLTATATSSSAFSYTATSSTAGTTFAWSRAAVTGISNAAATGNGNISETLVNTTTSPVNVTYVYTLTANGCTNTQNVVVTVGVDESIVSPAVTTQPASQTKCAGLNVSFSSAASGSPAPTVQWQESTNGTNWDNIPGATTGTLTFTTTAADNNKQYRAVWTNIAGPATSNAATLIVTPIPAAPFISVANNCGNSVLTATGAPGATFLWSTGATTSSITVTTAGTYTVTQTVNDCTSPPDSGVAAPRTMPVLSSNLSATATSGTTFTYTATSTTAGTTFAWSREAVAGISNAAENGTGSINESLVNTTTLPVNVTYVYILTANGCNNTQNVVVTVNPVATVNCTINGSSMVADFNSTEVPAGSFIWFNSSFDPGSLGTGTSTVTMSFTNTVITFTANSQQYILNVPEARVRFDDLALSASTQFVNGIWETVVPRSFTDYVFMTGLSYQVPINFPGSISDVRWTTNVSIDRTNTSIEWRWSAAVYTTFAAHPGIAVKPVNGSTLNPYPNSDKAGTPENFKTSLVDGARGDGGTNYTGSYVNSGDITCSTIGTRSSAEPLITKQTMADRVHDLVIERLKEASDFNVQVMPNPSSTFFNLAIRGSNESPVTIKIMDIFGRVVERHDRIAANTVLKVGDKWTNGSYYVEVVQGNQRKIIKIIKAR